MLKEDHLKKLGIVRKWMKLDYDKLEALALNMSQKTKEEISLLKDQLLELYARVNMNVSDVIFAIKASLITSIV
jgi:hypothetical protein